MTKRCENCAWYCHADCRCYAHQLDWDNHGFSMKLDLTYTPVKPDSGFCSNWAADGLEDWERETALMTVEAA